MPAGAISHFIHDDVSEVRGEDAGRIGIDLDVGHGQGDTFAFAGQTAAEISERVRGIEITILGQ